MMGGGEGIAKGAQKQKPVGPKQPKLNTSFHLALSAGRAETFCQLEHEPNRFCGSIQAVLGAD